MINKRYKIIKKIGSGRSEIFLCEDKENDNQLYALKILPVSADTKETNTFRDEFLILNRLKHKNIVKAFHYDSIIELDNIKISDSVGVRSKFYVMEYLDGKTLDQIDKDLSEKEIFDIIKQIARVLNYLHSFNIIYHDLKLENIILLNTGNGIEIKLVDFGLVQNLYEKETASRKGTIEYMAPELLGTENYDNRIDFYSLGVILYWLIYRKFPFEGESHLEILNAHLEKEPEFPDTNISEEIISIAKMLLCKNQDDRYLSAIELLKDLNDDLSAGFKDFSIPKVFVSNSIAYSLVQDQMKHQRDERTLVISGGQGSGKTTLIEEVYYHYKNVILIRKSDFKKSKSFWETILHKIIYTQFIFPHLSADLFKNIIAFQKKPSAALKDELKNILSKVCQRHKFVLIIDDFNLLDPKIIEFFIGIIPILTINDIVVILTENSNFPSKTISLKQKIDRTLQPMTHEQVKSYINKTFSQNFDLESLINVVEGYTDCFPGNIDLLLNNLVFLNSFVYEDNRICIDLSENTKALLGKHVEELNKIKFQSISIQSQNIARIISLFEVNIRIGDLFYLVDDDRKVLGEILIELENNNIIRISNENEISFTSPSLKEYAYSTIDNDEIIRNAADKLANSESHNISNAEISRFFEQTSQYEKSYATLLKEYKLAESLRTYSYQREILEHIISLPLQSDIITQSKFNLIDINILLGNFNRAIELLSDMEGQSLTEEENQKCSIYRAQALMGTADYQQAKNIYESLENEKQNLINENVIKYEIASAELYMHQTNSAEELCNNILNSTKTGNDLRAKTFNLLGMIKYESNELDEAIKYFKQSLNIYTSERNNLSAAKAEKNIGNIYYLKGDRAKAKYHWDRARQKNKLVGSLEEEAFILLNYGNYYFDSLELESAIENYIQSSTILSNLGRQSGKEIVLTNLAEAYLMACEYDKALTTLSEAEQLINLSESDITELWRIYYLIGLVYYNLSSTKMLQKVIGFLEEQKELNKGNIYPALIQDYLIALQNKLMQNEIDFSLISRNRQYCIKEKIDDLFKKYNLLYAEVSIENNNLNYAYEALNFGLFNDLIRDNPYDEAYKKYLLGKISKLSNGQTFKSHIDYFESAYSFLSECSITELTWKITFALAESFAERGNLTKAQSYLNLTKSLIDHLSMNIKNIEFRSSYLDNKERRKVLKILENWSTIIK